MGQRRLTAARILDLPTVPVQLRQRPGGRTRVLEQLEENRRRAEMSCIDEALAFRRLADEGMTQAEIGKRFERALAKADGFSGAHCIHEMWMRGEMSINIERALE